MESLLGRSRKHDVAFYSSGRIDINAYAARAIGLKAGDAIDIMDDGDDLLLYVRHRASDMVGKYEGQCYATNRFKFICNSFRAHSVRLCRAMLARCGVEQVAKLQAGEARELGAWGTGLPLITRHLL